jgi:uncharacterized protein (DUF1501 family)
MNAINLTRRKFLVGGAAAGLAGAGALAVAQHPWTRLVGPSSRPAGLDTGKGILVLVTLYGGNDGLNTVIPYTDSRYLSSRSTLGYQPAEVLPLADGLGLHPNLKGLKGLWDAKQLAIVRGVGYPQPVRSHFRSMDIWQSGVPDSPVVTGWLGRWLDATGTDPMRALSVGNTLPRLLTGAKQAGTAVTGGGIKLPGGPRIGSAVAALDIPGSDRATLAARVASSGSDLLKVQHALADLLGGSASPAGAGGPHLETAPPSTPGTSTPPVTKGGAKRGPAPAAGGGAGGGAGANPLTAELDVVARLIKAGAPTKVYQVSMGGFDNHAQEKDVHARLMGDLDASISGFFGALKGDPRAGGVVVMTYSEFGRRVAQNASGGTDHGTAAPLFIAGPAVKGGKFFGDEPSLTVLDQGDLRYTTDFRSVYSSVLAKVLGVDPTVALGRNWPVLDIV